MRSLGAALPQIPKAVTLTVIVTGQVPDILGAGIGFQIMQRIAAPPRATADASGKAGRRSSRRRTGDGKQSTTWLCSKRHPRRWPALLDRRICRIVKL